MQANNLINADELYFIPGTEESIQEATESEAGLMSATDKIKLNNIEDGANKTIVDSELSTTSTNPVQNSVIKTKLDLIQGNIDALKYDDVGIFVSETEPADAVDGDIWFDISSEPVPNGDEVTY